MILEDLATAVINGDDAAARGLVAQSLVAGLPAQEVLNRGLLAGMAVVGQRFRAGEYFLPEVLIAADALKSALALLQPRLVAENVRPAATAVVGTVAGDLHDIGKNLVATMLQGAGFEVIDLGVDVPPEQFVSACQQRPVHLVALSALLTTTMPQMPATIAALRRLIQPTPKIFVGGAPVSSSYAAQVGADGYAPDAASAADLALRLCLPAPP